MCRPVFTTAFLSLPCFTLTDGVQDINGAPGITVYFDFSSNQFLCVAVTQQQQPQAFAECCLREPKVILTLKTHPGQTLKSLASLVFYQILTFFKTGGDVSQNTLTAVQDTRK